MYMIEQVTGYTFEYDKIHKALKIVADLPEIRVPPVGLGEVAVAEADTLASGAAAAGDSLPPCVSPHSSSCHGGPPSPIRRFFSSMFGMCRDIQVR